MPASSKNASWHRIGLREIRAAKLDKRYPNDYCETIIEAVQIAERSQVEDLLHRGIEIAKLYWGSEYYQSRPKLTERRRSLTSLAKRLADYLSAIKNLDDDTRRDLELAADANQQDLADDIPRSVAEITLEGRTYGGVGDVRIGNTIERLETELSWIQEARRNLGTAPKGRPREDARRWAIQRLCDLWEEVTGARPTLCVDADTEKAYGPFLCYVTLILRPVMPPEDLRKGPEKLVREALYGQKAVSTDPN